MAPPIRTAPPKCPDCGFRVFNRRFPKCESCGAVLPASMVYTANELLALQEDDLKSEKLHQANLVRLKGDNNRLGEGDDGAGGSGGDVFGFD